ncbi:hypothetical protein CONCODRAFT_170966 [Conidiobolus coronatus NRRL 28638]|uniref:Phosphatidylserine decarboxylase n=1 Tax=Conidiobolus coronatus (strain ATCC 28846 / CBS 209.66 / NRRL 28638) TaxID=796925 RepID=A0A137NPF2_CONC2|nr:hypothetical protein CONCODRAFT_170966 [Conidiobolus coronatus NRRL 28638]|eukprot:KXN64617.1 hypothetical protein CONCODRAFT_170966 [Conidiobolus coronatus NRRL 28638]
MSNSRVGGSRPSSPNPDCSSEHVKDSDLDIVSHISLCYSADPSKIDRIIMGNMVTEAHAQRKWFTKIATYVGYGSYETGVDNANILVQDRKSGEILEEKMPVYIRMGIRLLYRTGKSATTSSVKKILRNMSIKQGEKYTDILSKREIAPFIRFHNLNTEEILDPLDSFQNFNEFFYQDPRVAVSPADSRVMVFPTIDIAKELWIKGENFSVQNLVKSAVKDPQVIDSLNQGSLAIFRLAPQDYHRFHIPVDGIIGEPHKIEGEYYTVNPMAIRSNLDVYGNNTRVVSVINSPEYGNVVVCCIGAMMVGSIVLTSTPHQPVQRLQEHGYFAFGGSTIVVLFEKGKIVFDKDLVENSQNKIETLLAVGNQIGVKP